MYMFKNSSSLALCKLATTKIEQMPPLYSPRWYFEFLYVRMADIRLIPDPNYLKGKQTNLRLTIHNIISVVKSARPTAKSAQN